MNKRKLKKQQKIKDKRQLEIQRVVNSLFEWMQNPFPIAKTDKYDNLTIEELELEMKRLMEEINKNQETFCIPKVFCEQT